MQLVILAAGHGRRFGGLKQLAPVGPNGETIMDYTARTAEACGYAGVVVVVRDEIRDEIADHCRRAWPASLEVELVCQPPLPGTAQAVLAARGALSGPFGVANADDLYGAAALEHLYAAFTAPDGSSGGGPGGGSGGGPARSRGSAHLLVAYHLERTVLSAGPVTRGLCSVSDSGELLEIVEHRVERSGGTGFDAVPLDEQRPRRRLAGHELVSMNLWGFEARMLGHLEAALDRFVPGTHGRNELLLPDVVGQLLEDGTDEVRVVETASRCIGVTHKEDLALVEAELAAAAAATSGDLARP